MVSCGIGSCSSSSIEYASTIDNNAFISMIIPIHLTCPSTSSSPIFASLGSGEVVLIELQGSLDVIEGEKRGGFIGTMTIDNDKPSLRIGHHLLEGKITTLPKALAVLRSNKNGDDPGDIAYQVMAVVKKKILFSKRPVPIIANRG